MRCDDVWLVHGKANMKEDRPDVDALCTKAAYCRDWGAETMGKCIVIEIELRRQAVEPFLEIFIMCEDLAVGNGTEGEHVVYDIPQKVCKPKECKVRNEQASG